MEYWLAMAIGASIAAVMLALFARFPAKTLALQGYFALCVMLSIYLGAKLVTGTLTEILIETAIACAAAGIAWVAMQRWLPSIGAAIILHGCYDALIGPHTGVAEWYPPLCAGFDWVAGTALIVILMRKNRD